MTDTSTSTGKGAFRLRQPIYRERPWISDGVWLAHESLTIFAAIAAQLPSNGAWSLGDSGGYAPRKVGEAPPLAAHLAIAYAESEPCVVHADQFRRWETDEAAHQAALYVDQVVEVLDTDGGLWCFDASIVEVAGLTSRGVQRPDWSWHLTRPSDDREVPILVAVDRKDRPRFGVAALRKQATAEATR